MNKTSPLSEVQILVPELRILTEINVPPSTKNNLQGVIAKACSPTAPSLNFII